MGDVCVMESAVTRQLQHAILQMCNEHVSYEHTLQVLGVICVTVDDQPRDLVVKLNNTLKRVDAVTPAADDRRAGTVRSAASTLWPRASAGGDAPPACSSSTAVGPSSTASPGDQPHARQATTDATPAETGSSRKCHGRKQSNPVRVKTVMDDDDDDEDHDCSTSDCRSGSVLLSPVETSAFEDDLGANPSLSSPRILRSVGGPHLDVEEELRQRGRRLADTPSPAVGGSSAVRPLLTGMAADGDAGGDRFRRSSTPRSVFSSSEPSDRRRRDCASADVQESALNFSTRTSAEADVFPEDCVAGADVKIKQEPQQHATLPMTSYGLELCAGRGGTFDMSRSTTVAAAAAAVLGQYVDDRVVMQSLTSYDQQRLALYTSLVTAAAVTGSDDGPPPPLSLLKGAALDGADLPPPNLDRSSYVAMSAGQLGDELTMHRLPAMRRRERLGRSTHLGHQPSMKVKDIIMYDDSAPLHVQRGSRIEGDFMVDSLHVEGRKRRRRTAEDTLSAEEIAEYMGTSTSTGCGQFACRYCGEVSPDLSRYFAHTLSSHGSFVCHQCGKSFTTKSSLLRHRPIHTGMRRFACSICRKSFYRKDKCKAHIKRHLGITDRPSQCPSSSPAALSCSSGPGPPTPHLPPSMDHQLFTSGVGPVNLVV